MLKMTLLVASLSAPLFASAYSFPILQKTLGGLDKADGVSVTKTCAVYDDSSQIVLKDVLDLANQAEKEKLNKGQHIVRQMPSIEIWVNIPTRKAVGPAATGVGPRKVLLLADSSGIDQRDGKAAGELIDLVEKICKDLK